jgi:cobaltochelatase CobS
MCQGGGMNLIIDLIDCAVEYSMDQEKGLLGIYQVTGWLSTWCKVMTKKETDYLKSLATLQQELQAKPFKEVTVAASGELPNGKIVMKPLNEVFPVTTSANFEVPVWEWDAPHPDVPEIDPDYIFRPSELTRVLYAALTNQRAYLQGHTGTGKTTLVEQAAARLNQPFKRLNFDSEITRMDLIGRDVLKTDEAGNTISKFVDGILPQAMVAPYWLCLDEIDFVRPDVAYVIQSMLEGNGINITEDGARRVQPHEGFRMFATGNTVGQGDEMGMYQGARPQSLALLDRFTVWVKVGYLSKDQRGKLLKDKFPALLPAQVNTINNYVEEHITAFTQAKVLQPISPRGMMAIARATAFFSGFGNPQPLKEALASVVLDKASQQDYPVLQGIIDRVVK